MIFTVLFLIIFGFINNQALSEPRTVDFTSPYDNTRYNYTEAEEYCTNRGLELPSDVSLNSKAFKAFRLAFETKWNLTLVPFWRRKPLYNDFEPHRCPVLNDVKIRKRCSKKLRVLCTTTVPDPCMYNPCHKYATCKTFADSYTCTCSSDSVGNGTYCEARFLSHGSCQYYFSQIVVDTRDTADAKCRERGSTLAMFKSASQQQFAADSAQLLFGARNLEFIVGAGRSGITKSFDWLDGDFVIADLNQMAVSGYEDCVIFDTSKKEFRRVDCKPLVHRFTCEKPANDTEDPCSKNTTCKHGGACTRIGCSYRCACPKGFYGHSCQHSRPIAVIMIPEKITVMPGSNVNISIYIVTYVGGTRTLVLRRNVKEIDSRVWQNMDGKFVQSKNYVITNVTSNTKIWANAKLRVGDEIFTQVKKTVIKIKKQDSFKNDLLLQNDVLKLRPCSDELYYSRDSENGECGTIAALVKNISESTITQNFVEIATLQLKELTNSLPNLDADESKDAIILIRRKVEEHKIKITPLTMENVVKTADVINERAEENTDESWDRMEDVIEKRSNILLVTSLEGLAAWVELEEDEAFSLKTNSINLQISRTKPKSFEDISYTDFLDNADGSKLIVKAEIPKSAVLLAQGALLNESTNHQNSINVVFMFYKNNGLLRTGDGNIIAEQVISAQVGQESLSDLETPFSFQMSEDRRSEELRRQLRYYRCGYFNVEKEKWAYDGCDMVPGSNPPRCFCDHMTNFALLVYVVPFPTEYVLGTFGKISCGISILSLALMLIIYIAISSLRMKTINQIHIHLCTNMLLAYLTFVLGVERPRPFIPCVIVAVVLHFTLLSTWGWMTVECHIMYRKFVSVLKFTSDHYVRNASSVVYFASVIIVIPTVAITFSWDRMKFRDWEPDPESDVISTYINGKMCWMSGMVHYTSFLVPVGFLLIFNLIGYILIMRAITWGRKKITSTAKTSVKLNMRRCFTLSVLFGLAWVLAIPLNSSDDNLTHVIFSWLFTITNSLQGLLIFLLFCVMRDDVRKLWWNPLRNYFCCFEDESQHVTNKRQAIRRTQTSDTKPATGVDKPNNISEARIHVKKGGQSAEIDTQSVDIWITIR